ncbi:MULTISPECIES: helix-turn-helix domain-containing protein [Pseudomonas]|uniref:Helix-turn-helix domain-containing protein n=1 Tax=Pseudomonas quercus TaxID=2722792 RepID=A0ABX0Y9G2_9PSED|nr:MULTISPECIES: helix-turn-helix domain-containing protein [Pseudomonas]MBF7141430.1 helix-turn-helix domain-containing protein [Pseudomonas sp. LY10J]NJO99968.1 helix-turn-helix domain-containing protein [Pseudomonas quercus]
MNTEFYSSVHIDSSIQKLRSKIAGSLGTVLIDGHIWDKHNGELYGSYIGISFCREDALENKPLSTSSVNRYFIGEDGSPYVNAQISAENGVIGTVIDLPSKPVAIKATSGRKARTITNPVAVALMALRLEKQWTPWLDDIVYGAIHTGPGVIRGKQSVAFADVMKVLRLPELSVENAAGVLLNHDREPMSTRQLQRVVQAARIAIAGIALYLERHPEVLRPVELSLDFDQLWKPQDNGPAQVSIAQHPLKNQVLEMIRSGIPVKTTANQLGISKNTVKKWRDQNKSAG